MDALTLELARSQPLASLYEPLLEQVIDACEATHINFRSKALRNIGLIVAQDPDLFLQVSRLTSFGLRSSLLMLLSQENVHRSIENRILDQASSVRDAAIELVGKYVVARPDVAVKYLPVIAERISVRSPIPPLLS